MPWSPSINHQAFSSQALPTRGPDSRDQAATTPSVRCPEEVFFDDKLHSQSRNSFDMRFSTIGAALASASLAVASPTWPSEQERRDSSLSHAVADRVSSRPQLSFHPRQPFRHAPAPGRRCKTCFGQSHNDGVTDDSKYILDAFHKCNNGGHVVFRQGLKYAIGTAMDWTFLNHIDIGRSIHKYTPSCQR